MTLSLLWIPVTIAAAFLQNLRSALQKQMTGDLGVSGVTFARFAYGFPFALAYLLVLVLAFDFPMPEPNAASLGYAAVGGLAQIFGTLTLVTAFSLGGEGFLAQAAFTLACVTVFQTLAMTAWFAWRRPETLRRVAGAWRRAVWIGVVGAAASGCWFIAMTIQNAAYVRALGQIELVFTFIAAVLIFRERSNRRELSGVSLVVAGLLLLLLAG